MQNLRKLIVSEHHNFVALNERYNGFLSVKKSNFFDNFSEKKRDFLTNI